MTARTPKLVDLLTEWRARGRKTQSAAAAALSISRKTYVLFEAGRWLPPDREKPFFAHVLHAVDPRLGHAFARACGASPGALGISSPVTVTAPGPAEARAAYDAAVYSAAEAADISPKTARLLVAAVVEKLDEAGVTMAQARVLGGAVAENRK